MYLSIFPTNNNFMISFFPRGEAIPDSICEGDGGGPLICPRKDDSSR